MKKILALSLSSLVAGTVLNHRPMPKETLMSFEEICKFRGYNADTHEVTTEDGYVLTLFRLRSGVAAKKRPILLVHGLTHTAATFVVNQSVKGPAFRLVDESHDVWLLNTRGNFLSRKHVELDSKSEEYWQWTSNEIGKFDIPATIDYILKDTNVDKINYLGHSQGGFVIMFCLATRPEYASKVNLAALFAPPGGGQITTKAEYLKNILDPQLIENLERDKVYLIADKTQALNLLASDVFNNIESAAKYKDRYDYTLHNEDPEVMIVYLQHFCGGTSLNNLKYFRQFINRNSPFVYCYDHGEAGNMLKYGNKEPPLVDFGKIQSKLAVFYGKYDGVCSSENGANLLSLLPKDKVVFAKLDYELDHSGFTVSPYQQHMDDLIRVLNEHSS